MPNQSIERGDGASRAAPPLRTPLTLSGHTLPNKATARPVLCSPQPVPGTAWLGRLSVSETARIVRVTTAARLCSCFHARRVRQQAGSATASAATPARPARRQSRRATGHARTAAGCRQRRPSRPPPRQLPPGRTRPGRGRQHRASHAAPARSPLRQSPGSASGARATMLPAAVAELQLLQLAGLRLRAAAGRRYE